MAIDFSCPHCQTPMRVAERMAGRTLACAKCRAAVVVPHLPDAVAVVDEVVPDAQVTGPAPPQLITVKDNPYASPKETASPPQYTDENHWQPRRIELATVLRDARSVFRQGWLQGSLVVTVEWLIWLAGLAIATVIVLGSVALGIRGPALATMDAVCTLMVWIVGVWLSVGRNVYFLACANRDPTLFGALFSGGRYQRASFTYRIAAWFRTLPGIAVAAAAVMLASLGYASGNLALVPLADFGACAAIAFFLSAVYAGFFLIIDFDLSIGDSLKAARLMFRANRLPFWLVGMISVSIAGLGLLAFGVGLFPALAFVHTLLATAYLQARGPLPEESTPPLTVEVDSPG